MQFTSPTLELLNTTAPVSTPTGNINPAMTTANVGNLLREMAVWLAENPEEHILFPRPYLDQAEDRRMREKVNHSYVRNTMNRVQAVREVGKIKVTSAVNDDGQECFRLQAAPGEFIKSASKPDGRSLIAARRAVRRAMFNMSEFKIDVSFLADESITPLKAVLNVTEQFKAACLAEIDAIDKKDLEQ